MTLFRRLVLLSIAYAIKGDIVKRAGVKAQ